MCALPDDFDKNCVKDQVETYLGEFADEFDVDAIVAEVMGQPGLVRSVDDIDSATFLGIVDRHELGSADEPAPNRGAARARLVACEVALALEKEMPSWSADVIAERDGLLLELESFVGTSNYDYVGILDMRGRDPLSSHDWAVAARELAYGFDVDEEVELNLGARGAPSVSVMVRDFEDLARELEDVLDVVTRASGTALKSLGSDARCPNPPLENVAKEAPGATGPLKGEPEVAVREPPQR